MRPVKLPRMSQKEIDELLEGQVICRIAFMDKEYPYIAPFQYALDNGQIFFHFTNYGRKMKIVERNDRVCVAVERLADDLSDFRFVVLRGRLVRVDDPEEKGRVIEKLSVEGSRKLSERFLVAHGFEDHMNWDDMTPDREMIIFKLVESETIGLKSPS